MIGIGAVIEEIPGIVSVLLFTPEECARIMAEAEQSGRWEAATVHKEADDGAGQSVVNTEVRQASVIGLSSLPFVSQLFDRRMAEIILPHIESRWNMRLEKHEGAQLLRYHPGGFYLAHSDNGDPFEERQFSIVCYLNEDVDGGATSFPDIAYTVTPQRGKAIIFPSEYLHQAQAVTAGSKYAIVSWVVGAAPVSWI
jgi:predicted 2-oxoglutarate/Fe(II)-dependent dioxygenase YbiX